MNLKPTDSVTNVSGIGTKYQTLLEKLRIKTVDDLLWHLPFRYEDRTSIKTIVQLIPNEKASVICKVEKINNIFTRNGKRLTKATFSDQTGTLEAVWFNQTYVLKSLPVGSTVKLFGELDQNASKPQFTSPEFEIHDEAKNPDLEPFLPIYPTTNGISNKWLRAKIEETLNQTDVEDIISPTIRKKHALASILESLKAIHKPSDLKSLDFYKKRLAFEELMFLHLHGLLTRAKWDNKKNSHRIELSKEKLNIFHKSLPFKLTDAQNRAIGEILSDLGKPAPMNRLLQGDVGSGKTVVAAAAILAAAQSGYNTILMAPTQILAEQHYKTLEKILKDSEIHIILLTGKGNNPLSKDKLKNLAKPYLVVSTHAILHNLENFKEIGLLVVDEQHKFGVEQRTIVVDYYTKKDELADIIPNLLTMTATPIPRSLALTFYGDLDLSIIDELPKNRKPIKTWVINESKRKGAYQWIQKEILAKDIQAFVVCPFIEESENTNFQNVKAAEIEYEKLLKIFPDLKIGLLHGRMKASEKDNVINDMINNKLHILVTTPVIEVGVDIPNANIIFIETPERFGLASLHQLRGRVGRGNKQSYCFLITSSKSSNSIERLKYMEKLHEGNKLAEIDLKLRGPGDIYGTNQHGFVDLKAADISDIDLIKETKTVAQEIFANLDKHQQIKERLISKKYVEEN